MDCSILKKLELVAKKVPRYEIGSAEVTKSDVDQRGAIATLERKVKAYEKPAVNFFRDKMLVSVAVATIRACQK